MFRSVNIVLIIGLFLCSCNNSQKEATNDARQARIAVVDSSINEVAGLLGRAGLTIRYSDVIMITHLLRQQFNMDFDFPPVADFVERSPHLLNHYFKLYDYYFDGKFYVNRSDEETWKNINKGLENNDLNTLTFWSMYCHKFPLDERFLGSIQEKITNPPRYPDPKNKKVPPEEYWVLHAALQLQGAFNSDCLAQTAEVDQLLADVQNGVISIMNKENLKTAAFDQDIWLESIAMMYYMGLDEKVPEAQIDAVLASQLYGGGWAYQTGSESTSLHSSMLAMWVLLEYKESLLLAEKN